MTHDRWANHDFIIRKKNRKGWKSGHQYTEWTEWQVWQGKIILARFPTRQEAELEKAVRESGN